jgi:signal transduction histidine kinase
MHSSIPLMPHAVCWRQDPHLIWTMAISNLVTFISYVAICLTLFYLAHKTRRVIARDWAFFVVGFALFIVACGSTHLMEVVTTWVPVFWVDAATNVVTALLSGYVAVQFFRRAQTIGFGINDYADRLGSTEQEKARMEESLLAAQKLEDWSRLSASLSHEIANPLESVQNLLYIISTVPEASDEIRGYAREAADEANNAGRLARNTLDFFRQSNSAERTDLCAAAESVGSVLRNMMREKNVAFSVHCEGDVAVAARAGEPRQVLLNLVRNGVEASAKAGGSVEVKLLGEAAGVKIVIADSGTGVDPAVLPDLFRFGVTTKGASGTGLGLWTVHHILKRHGGTVEVHSEPGKGTAFTLWWPRDFPSAHDDGGIPISALAGEAAGEVFRL